MKSKADDRANEFLTEKVQYQLVRITKNEETEEEESTPISIESSLVMTLEEEQAAEGEDEE